MKIRIATAAASLVFGVCAAGIAIAQVAGSWPQVTRADLEACRTVISQAHKKEYDFINANIATYCTPGKGDYSAESCKGQREWLAETKAVDDVDWYYKGNGRCEMSDYPCFGPGLYNDPQEGENAEYWAKHFIESAAKSQAVTPSMELWDATDAAGNCTAGIWVKKLNAAGGVSSFKARAQPAQPVQPARPVAAAPIKASDPTFQSNLKTFGDQQLLALVDELLSTGNIDVAKLARNALLQRFPDSPLTITVAQRLADAIKTAPAAAPPPPPPLAVQNVTGQRVFMNNEASVIQAFAKVGFNLAQSPDNPKELRQDKNYFTVWIADCDTAPCKALQIRGQYLPTPMPSKARLDEWNAGKLYGRGYLSGGFVTFDMIIPIPSKGIDLDDLKESIDRFVTQSDYFYTAVTKP